MSAELISQVVSAAMAIITFISGALFAAVPWLTRRREAFAVTVPETAQADPRLAGMRRAYLVAMLVVSAAAAAGTFLLGAANPIALTAVVCVPAATGFILMLVFRARVQALKRAEGWHAAHARTSTVAGTTDRNAPRPLPLTWNLAYIPLMLATLAITLALYPAMPDPVPTHFNAAGVADELTPKGWQIIAMPIAIQAFLVLCFTASHAMMLRSRRPAAPENPAASAIAYGMFARAQSVALLVTGLVAAASIAAMPFAFAGILTAEHSVILLIVICVAALVPTVAISLVYGQNGSRLMRRMAAAPELELDDDEHWKLGVFYVNREDPTLVLPKRFGIGWAFNWGNPKSWALAAALVAAIVVFVVVIEVMLA